MAGYAGLINCYINASHSPAARKAVLGLAASAAAMAASMQAVTEISLWVLLVLGVLRRPVALIPYLFLTSLWGFGMEHGVDLGTFGPDAGIACARGGTGRPDLGR
jgi:uncharacterized membrane protein YphA (DoxX/SURF4 family)